MQSNNTSLTERIKRITTVSDASEKLSISRPSMYKYISCYESGDYDVIPKHVRDFFDFLMSNEADLASTKVYLNLIADETDSKDEISYENGVKDLDTLRDELNNIKKELECCVFEEEVITSKFEEQIENTDDFDLKRDLLDKCHKTKTSIGDRISNLQDKSEMLMHELLIKTKELEKMRLRSTAAREAKHVWSSGNNVKTLSIGAGGRSMVIFNMDFKAENVFVRVYLGEEDNRLIIGDFKPELGKNYVYMSDLIPRSDYYYSVFFNKDGKEEFTKEMQLLFK